MSRNERPAPKIRRSEWSGAYIRFAFVRRRDRKLTRGNLTVGTSVGYYTVPLDIVPTTGNGETRPGIYIDTSNTPVHGRFFLKVSRYRDPVCRFGERTKSERYLTRSATGGEKPSRVLYAVRLRLVANDPVAKQGILQRECHTCCTGDGLSWEFSLFPHRDKKSSLTTF